MIMNLNTQNFQMKKKKLKKHKKQKVKDLFLQRHNYVKWFWYSRLWRSDDDKILEGNISTMPTPKDDWEEIKDWKRIKIWTPNKLLTRLSALLVQIKAGNNSYKLKNKIRQIAYLLCQHDKITKKRYYNFIKSLQ